MKNQQRGTIDVSPESATPVIPKSWVVIRDDRRSKSAVGSTAESEIQIGLFSFGSSPNDATEGDLCGQPNNMACLPAQCIKPINGQLKNQA
jgi:hypothetical protein